MHQTKLIYFYALTIAALILFALIVGGIVEIKVPVPCCFTLNVPYLELKTNWLGVAVKTL